MFSSLGFDKLRSRSYTLKGVHRFLTNGPSGAKAPVPENLSPLMAACARGAVNDVWKLIAAGKNVNKPDADGVTPLMCACYHGHANIVRNLLASKADLKARDNAGDTALMRAAAQGHVDIVRLLLDQDKTTLDAQNKNGDSALMYASRQGQDEVVAVLLERGASTRMADSEGATALMMACQAGRLSVVQRLLASGADPHARDPDGDNSLRYAAMSGKVDMCTLILDRGVAINEPNLDGRTPLMLACYRGYVELVTLFLRREAHVNAKSRDGYTALMYAAGQGFLQIVMMLVEGGAEVNLETMKGDSALGMAANAGHEEVVRYLLDRGALTRAVNKENGCTALLAAAIHGHHSIVQILVQAGTNCRLRDVRGEDVLMKACSSGDYTVACLALAHGADFEATNRAGIPPLVMASNMASTEIVTLLTQLIEMNATLKKLLLLATKRTDPVTGAKIPIDIDRCVRILRRVRGSQIPHEILVGQFSSVFEELARNKRCKVRMVSRCVWEKWAGRPMVVDADSGTDSDSSVTSESETLDESLEDTLSEESEPEQDTLQPQPNGTSRNSTPSTLDTTRTETLPSSSATPSTTAAHSIPRDTVLIQSIPPKPVREIVLVPEFRSAIYWRKEMAARQPLPTHLVSVHMAHGNPEFDVRENYIATQILFTTPNLDFNIAFPRSQGSLYWKDYPLHNPRGEVDLLTTNEVVVFYHIDNWRTALGQVLTLRDQLEGTSLFRRQTKTVVLLGRPDSCPEAIAAALYRFGVDQVCYTAHPC